MYSVIFDVLDTTYKILRKHTDKLTAAITACLQQLADALYANKMISLEQMSANVYYNVFLYIIILGTPNEVLWKHSDKLTAEITPCLQQLADELYANKMITLEQRLAVQTLAIPAFNRACNLVGNIQRSLQGSLHPDQYLKKKLQYSPYNLPPSNYNSCQHLISIIPASC